LQVASNVADKLVGWSKVFGSILGVLTALIVVILGTLGYSSVSGFRTDVAKTQQDAKKTLNDEVQASQKALNDEVHASQKALEGLAQQLEENKVKWEATAEQLKRAGDETGRKLQQDRRAADDAARELSAVQNRAKGMAAELDAIPKIQQDVGNLTKVTQVNGAADNRLVYEMLFAEVNGADTVRSADAIQALRHILSAAGYKQDANSTAKELLASFKRAIQESVADNDKLAKLTLAVASANVETRRIRLAGTFPVSGDLAMDDLAAALTSEEQLGFEQLTGLAIDSTKARNLATFTNSPNQLGALSICASGAAAKGTKLFSTTAYVSGKQTKIDVYRLPLT
jgi:hypothetical protein